MAQHNVSIAFACTDNSLETVRDAARNAMVALAQGADAQLGMGRWKWVSHDVLEVNNIEVEGQKLEGRAFVVTAVIEDVDAPSIAVAGPMPFIRH